MKKTLSIVSSATLAIAMVASGSAMAQTARKAKAPSKAPRQIEQKAMPGKPLTKKSRLHQGTKRTASLPNMLSRAMKATGIKRHNPLKVARVVADLPNLQGVEIYSDNWEENLSGFYQINNDGTQEELFLGPAGVGAGVVDGYCWAIDFESWWGMIFITHTAYEIESGEMVYQGEPEDFSNIIYSMVSDPTTGKVYTIGYNSEGSGLQLGEASVDINSGITVSAIGNLPGNWNSLACAPDGQLYGIGYDGVENDDAFETTSSTLYKIDKNTASVTAVGVTGQLPQYLSSAAIDPVSGKMYWNVCSPAEDGILCEVDLATGVATKLFDLDGNAEIIGLNVATPLAEDGAPAVATNLAAQFTGGSLSGNITFTAPATTFDGNSASGNLTYKVLANGEEVATGSTQYGANVTAAVTVPASGEYTFSVVTENSVGASPVAKLKLFVGFGTPAPAENVELVYNNGQMELTWDAVSTSSDGGYIDPANVSYKVTRFPDDVVVYEGTATSFTEPMGEPSNLTQYYYTVVAIADGVEGEVATSNIVTLGNIVPPYINEFDNAADLDGFTIIDANGDGKQWSIANNAVRMTYNASMDMDDWLITPALKLEGGKMYKVTFNARANGYSYPERVEAKWGNAPTVAAMTNNLVDPTVLNSTTFVELGNFICPATTGLYYVGIHGISDADMYYLYVDDLAVSAAMDATVPGPATDLNVAPDPNGELKATITFKAPAVDMAGDPLTAITKIELSRNGELIHTFTDVTPGEELSYEDEVETNGNNEYSVVAYSTSGQGDVATIVAFIGIDKPAAPTNVTIVETSPGNVTLSWNAVNTDQNGNSINPALVTYTVCNYEGGDWIPIAENLTATSFNYAAVPAGQQDFVQLAVFAVTEGGENGAVSDMIAVGTPYNGINESFENGELHYIWGAGYTEGSAQWNIYTDEDFTDISSCDGDNGFAAMRGQYLEDTSALFTGKIALGTNNPGVSFYTYNIVNGEDPDTNEFQIYVQEAGSEEWTAIGEPIVVNDLNPDVNGWTKAMVSLEAYAGKVIQVRFQVTVTSFAYTMLDKVKIGEMPEKDLAISKISAPASVKCGSDFNVDVVIANEGMQESGEYTVALYEGTEAIAYENKDALASGVSETLSFNLTMSPLATEPVKYFAVVTYVGDENNVNNVSSVIEVTPVVSNLPAVTDLEGAEENGAVKLTWSEPDLSNAPVTPEEVDFEDATAWAQEYEGWTFVDVDESPVGGFQGLDIPGITPGTTTASFFIFDGSADGFNQTFAAHSGDKYLASLFRYDDGKADDWAISPELSGDAQTITFYARSYSSNYPESIEMYYSTATTAIADFVKVGETVGSVPGEWTQYSFDVPAGAKHFAVRSCATGSFMLMMDDFTFQAAGGSSAELTIVGYDVYRDGVKITAEPTAECEYVDAEATPGAHTYAVVTVYTTGMSGASNFVTLGYVGIDAASSALAIKAGKGNISVNGAEGLMTTITGADGKVIFSAVANARENVAAPAGVYVVKAGNKVVKVIVK